MAFLLVVETPEKICRFAARSKARCACIALWDLFSPSRIALATAEVATEAAKLDSLYGTTGNGQLAFGHDIGDESVVGGTESGTYVSINSDAGNAIGDIEFLDAAFPATTVAPPALSPPSQDYGNQAWVPFELTNGRTGYWAPKGDGTYYYFGPDGTLYDDSYEGEVEPQDVASNAIGNVATYDFPNVDPSGNDEGSSSSSYYGGLYY